MPLPSASVRVSTVAAAAVTEEATVLPLKVTTPLASMVALLLASSKMVAADAAPIAVIVALVSKTTFTSTTLPLSSVVVPVS